MMRVLLAVLAAALFGLAGCEKKEPTIGDQIDKVQQEAEKTAEEAKEGAEKTAEEAQKTVEETKEAAPAPAQPAQ